MKNITIILIALFAFNFAGGQPPEGITPVKIAELTFETPGGYSTSITEFNDGTGDYFTRTNGSDLSTTYGNIQGSYFFSAEDIDDNSTIALPVTFLINNINISGYENLEFRIYLAEDDSSDGDEDWDNPISGTHDYVHITYDIDKSSTFNNLLWVEPNGTGANNEPAIDSNFDGTGDGTIITDSFTQFIQSITGLGSLLDIEIEFSLNAGDEDIAIDNIEIWGTQVACSSIATWDGSNWSPSPPDLTTSVQLNADYDTGIYGNFNACSLTLNNANLNIADNTFVEVQNELTVDASSSIYVQPWGAFVQKNDLSVNNVSGNISVDKLTSEMNAWHEYTYWSSPVSGTQFGNAVWDSHPERRFIFNGENFLDAFAESNNNDAAITGQDGIDDNGNDWEWVSGNTVMEPGKGYASTLTKFAYDINPQPSNKTFRFTFEGDFNNGKYDKIEIYRNDSELNDTNWNFIGNPYPSALDVDLFLEANNNLDYAIFLWSQNTPPSSTVNGNQQQNFSNDDYAIINATGETKGGDNVTPSRYIPSGQGFFVSMSNSAPADFVSGTVYTSNIVFSNSMRVTDITANNKFFKGSNKKKSATKYNKLWLNLTSDNGVFNQILIGYVNGASIYDDGLAYDAPKNPTQGAALYSVIEGSNKKFAIQGKNINSITEEETIKLGFKTKINVATLYTISIAKMEGDFLNSHSVFVKDNLLNKVHDLTVCDYTFTSETGEFNNRFEIVFKADALSTADALVNPSQLKIVELENDNVQFTAPNGLRIKTVSVFDLYGRQLYEFSGQNDTEVFQLSNLNRSVFVAEVTLNNGTVISKKAIKK